MGLKVNRRYVALVLAVLALFAAAGWVAAQRRFTPLESLFLQLLVMLVGIAATMFAGYRTLQPSDGGAMRRPVRSALRRVAALQSGYTRIGRFLAVERERLAEAADADGRIPAGHVRLSLDLLEAQLGEQSETLRDALDDWRDLAPAEVAEVEARLGKRLEP